jgi:HlyD family secretion protein
MHSSKVESPPVSGLLKPATIAATLAALVLGGVGVYTALRSRTTQSVTPIPATRISAVETVAALGRLEPQGEVIKLAAPTSTEGSRVEQLLVKQGDRVKAGQIIAILDSHDRLQAALQEAQEQVSVAQTKLAQVKAGAKLGEIQAQQAAVARLEAEQRGNIAAQRATVARLEAELDNAQAEDRRYQALFQEGAISASVLDSKQLVVRTAQKQLQEAQATLNRIQSAQTQQISEAKSTLNRIAEVRPVDVRVAESEVRSALASVKRAQANLAQSSVRSPRNGQVLKIHTWPGELVSSDGIVELGQTQQMYVVAEVYESDITKVRLGQPVQVRSDSFAGVLNGTVEEIGLRVQRQEVINSNPTDTIDARIVEVRVKLDPASSQTAAGLTNLQVKVAIAR